MALIGAPLHTARTRSRLLLEVDAPLLLSYRLENREHLAPWEPLRNESFFTLEHCQRTIAGGRQAAQQDQAFPYAIFATEGGPMIGSFTLANLVRGPFQACHLGYGMAATWQGQGLMHEVLENALGWAFGELGLHRVMANYLPRNERSGRLLQRLGFEQEGYAKRYLQIAGRWEDHVLTARYRLDD